MNTAIASFTTTVRQMTKMSQQKMTEIFQRKKSRSQLKINLCWQFIRAIPYRCFV